MVPGERTANYAKHPISAVLRLTPAALELHLQRLTEKLWSAVNGKVREAIQQSIARILVGVDGSLTIEAKPGGLLGLDEVSSQLGITAEYEHEMEQTRGASSGLAPLCPSFASSESRPRRGD